MPTTNGRTTMPNDPDMEDAYINKPVIIEVAQLIIDDLHSRTRKRYYPSDGKDLKFRWNSNESFAAEAAFAPNGDHVISMSYQSAIDIYKDAFLFTLLCDRTFTEKEFDPVFALVDYGNSRQNVLPDGLTPEDAKIEIIRLMTRWLYLHELSHLLQSHGPIADEIGQSNAMGGVGRVVDCASDTPMLEEYPSSVRHAFELSADYEAITWVLSTEGAKPGGLKTSTLWCLAAGLMCMFYRFYGTSLETPIATPTGTHPHPAIRMRMATQKVLWMIEKIPDFAQQCSDIGDVSQTRKVIDHAVYTTDMYYHIRHLGLEARGPFLDTVNRQIEVPLAYRGSLLKTWGGLRSKVVDAHIGYGSPVVLPYHAIDRL